MSILAAADVDVGPIIALGAVTIAGLRVHGWIDDEVLSELQKPFSRVTLTVVTLLAVMVTQLFWLASR